MKTNTNPTTFRNTVFGNLNALVLVTAMAFSSLTPAWADSMRGAETLSGRVAAYGTREYKVTFYGGEWARVEVLGDGDTDLDLYILDSNGNQVWTRTKAVMDEGPDDECEVEWIPAQTRTYTIRIVNRGRVYNNFELYHN